MSEINILTLSNMQLKLATAIMDQYHLAVDPAEAKNLPTEVGAGSISRLARFMKYASIIKGCVLSWENEGETTHPHRSTFVSAARQGAEVVVYVRQTVSYEDKNPEEVGFLLAGFEKFITTVFANDRGATISHVRERDKCSCSIRFYLPVTEEYLDQPEPGIAILG